MSIPHTTLTCNFSVLPEPPAGLHYRTERLGGEDYVTTGAFGGGGTRTLEDLRWAPVLVADFDMVDFLAREGGWTGNAKTKKAQMYRELADPAALAEAKARHRAEVSRCVLGGLGMFESTGRPYQRPTFYVDSGWGVHVYWLLKSPATGEAIAEVRKLNEELVRAINAIAEYPAADPGVHDTGTRLLRPLGSVNRKASDNPQPVQVIEEMSSPGLRWGDAVERVEPRAMQTRALSSVKPAKEPKAKAAADRAPSEPASPTPHTVPARDALAWLTGQDRGVRAAYEHALLEQTSEADWAFACSMARIRIPPAFTAIMLEHAVRVQAPHSHGGTDYFTRTAEKAWGVVHPGAVMSADLTWMLPHPEVLWRLRKGDGAGQVLHTAARFDPRVKAVLWTDERTQAVQWHAAPEAVQRWCAETGNPLPHYAGGRFEFTDEHCRHWCAWLDRLYGTSAAAHWGEMGGWLAGGLEHINPVREYLLRCAQAIPEGTDDALLDTWLTRVFGVEDTPLHRVYARKWLVGGAARGIDPGVFIKSMLVLVGAQSAGKSSALRLLVGERGYCSPEVRDLGQKDTAMQANSSWLLEFEEMAALNVSSIESVKRFVTMQEDRIRLPYGHTVQGFRRACFYAGTTNTAHLYADPSGAVRFWTVVVQQQADFAWLRENRDLLWGLAARAWLAVRTPSEPGSTAAEVGALDLLSEDRKALEEANADFGAADALHDRIVDAARRALNTTPAAQPGISWEALSMALQLANFRDLDMKSQARIRRVLESEGWKFRRARDPETGKLLSRCLWLPPQHVQDARGGAQVVPVPAAAPPVCTAGALRV